MLYQVGADAEREGLLGVDPDDLGDEPWAALVAMQATHVQAWIDQPEDNRFWAADGSVDHTDSAALARAIAARWPEHPASDHARMHLLDVLAAPSSANRDDDAALQTLREVLGGTTDGVVIEAALGRLTALGAPLPDGLLDELMEGGLDPESLSGDLVEALAVVGMEVGLRGDDPDDALAWAVRYEEALFQRCGAGGCGKERAALAAATGRAAAMTQTRAPDWRAEIVGRVHQCHDEAPVAGAVTARGAWAGGWQWTDGRVRLRSPPALIARSGPVGLPTTCRSYSTWRARSSKRHSAASPPDRAAPPLFFQESDISGVHPFSGVTANGGVRRGPDDRAAAERHPPSIPRLPGSQHLRRSSRCGGIPDPKTRAECTTQRTCCSRTSTPKPTCAP